MNIFVKLNERLGKNGIKLLHIGLVSLLAAVFSGALYTTVVRLAYGSWSFSTRVLYSADSLIRMLFFFVLYFFVISCIRFDRRKIFDFIFKNRWYVALCVFVLFVLLKINFSSVGAFDYFVQREYRTDTTLPIFGIPRSIRSDEWLVYVPRAFTSDFEGFDKYNYILRATENYSISANGLAFGYSALCSPMSWGYYLFGAEYGLSFYWSFLMVMTFMASYEFSYIISGKSRRVALFGAAFLGLSQFTMWWSVCTYLISAEMLIVAAYYFFGEGRIGRKLLLATVAAFSATLFITKLYPAWQVPMGYILIGLAVWLIIEKRYDIAKSKWYDVLIILFAVIFMGSMVLAYLLDTKEANAALLSTVYPGKRFDTGGMGLDKTGGFLYTLMLPFKEITKGNNNSDGSMFFSLFPIPMIYSAYALVRQIIAKRKNKSAKIDVFNAAVLIPTLFLTVYASVGFPTFLAKYSLLSYSMAVRVADMLGLANVYLMIRHLSLRDQRVPFKLFAPVAALSAVFWIYASYKKAPGYMPVWFCILALSFATGLAYVIYCRAPERIAAPALTSATALIAVLGLAVHPVMHGADALVEKPMSLEVREVVAEAPDAKWIGYGGNIVGQYLVANGAPTVNSVNYIPNLDFWHLFDPEGENEFIYNRYLHIAIEFTDAETEMELIQPDYARLVLNYGDIEKTNVRYVASITGIPELDLSLDEIKAKYGVEFREIYGDADAYIYEVIYHS